MKFSDIFIDDTKNVKRINSDEYLEKGKIAVIDQGKELIAGYTSDAVDNICFDTRIIFGDHTRIFKYIDFPFVCGADGTKVLKIIDPNKIDYKYMYYYLLASNIPNTGYNRHFKWVKDLLFKPVDIENQKKIVDKLDKIDNLIECRKKEIKKCDNLIKSQFVEMLYLNPSANKLGEFISRYKAERANDIDYPVLSITKEFGIVLQSEKFKKRIASDDTSSYKVVSYGKLVQGIHIDERNFAIQNIVDNGIVSPAYKIWNVDETKCNSEVLAYALRSDYVMNYIRSKFTGSIKRRENINYEDFMATPINLPKLEIQNEFYEKKKLIDKQKFVNRKIFQLLCKKLKK